MKRSSTVLLLLAVGISGVVLYAGYASVPKRFDTKREQGGNVRVVASFYPIYFFAQQIAQDRADVRNITPAGSEPHDYEPSAQDIVAIEQADLLILNGDLENWGEKIRDNLKGTDVVTVVAGQNLFTLQRKESAIRASDPHLWLDPMRAKQEAHAIADGFVRVDPSGEHAYRAGEQALDVKLEALDKEYRDGLAECAQNTIVTSHVAFGYLAERYNLQQVAIAGLSPEEEPSSQDLARITKQAKNQNIKYIFFESLVSPKLSETLANEIGAQTLVLDPLEGLTQDRIDAGADYFTVMRENLLNLRLALQCK